MNNPPPMNAVANLKALSLEICCDCPREQQRLVELATFH
jgi:hypothetical protein